MLVQLTAHESIQSLQAVCGPVAGCAIVNGQLCDVHVLEPQIGYPQDFTVIGHEFWHCWHGSFH